MLLRQCSLPVIVLVVAASALSCRASAPESKISADHPPSVAPQTASVQAADHIVTALKSYYAHAPLGGGWRVLKVTATETGAEVAISSPPASPSAFDGQYLKSVAALACPHPDHSSWQFVPNNGDIQLLVSPWLSSGVAATVSCRQTIVSARL